MKKAWPTEQLGKILQLQRRWVKLNALDEYTEIGIRSYGRGIFHKTPVDGASLGSKRVLQICPGDLVFMNVFAWEGAVAVAGPSEEGMIGSHRFATYTPINQSCDPRFLQLYFQTKAGRELLGRVSPGSAGRNRTMNLQMFSTQEVPCPSCEQQRRIVARIEELAHKITEATELQKRTLADSEALCRSFIFARPDDCMLTPLKQLVQRRPLDVTVQQDMTYQFAGVYCFGRGVFKGPLKAGSDFAYRNLTTLRTNDFVYPKLMAWEGALATVPSTCNGMVVSPEFPVFEVDKSKILPEVLDVYFRTPTVWPSLSGSSTGTNVRRRRLNPDDFLNIQMPVPPISVQRQLAKVRERTNALKQLRVQTDAELSALLPPVLDRAFQGEL